MSGPVDPLVLRLQKYQNKRWQRSESYNIINEFLLTPYLSSMIETLNKVHRIKVCADDNASIKALKFQFERDKKPGFWSAIKWFFSPYETAVMISHNGQLFLCEYYKHSFFEMCDKIKTDYDTKLKPTFGCDFVLVCRAK